MTFPPRHQSTADPTARRGTSDSPPGIIHLVIAQAANITGVGLAAMPWCRAGSVVRSNPAKDLRFLRLELVLGQRTCVPQLGEFPNLLERVPHGEVVRR
jgi:hypothetical protein